MTFTNQSYSSPAEKAYEVAGDSDATHEISRISKDNSIFVAALKVHLQVEKHTLLESVKMLLEGIAQRKHTHTHTVSSLCLMYRGVQVQTKWASWGTMAAP